MIQDDVVTGTLTVKENLQFSACLRLPSNMTKSQRKERVEKVIAETGATELCKYQGIYNALMNTYRQVISSVTFMTL